ncbi:MAG: hypothetical protein ACRYFX_23955 [Janthinobacterium lividum]
MQPHAPQLPTDAPTSPAPRNIKKGALLVLLAVAVAVALAAFLLPKKQVEGQNAPTSAQHRADAPAYQHPTKP